MGFGQKDTRSLDLLRGNLNQYLDRDLQIKMAQIQQQKDLAERGQISSILGQMEQDIAPKTEKSVVATPSIIPPDMITGTPSIPNFHATTKTRPVTDQEFNTSVERTSLELLRGGTDRSTKVADAVAKLHRKEMDTNETPENALLKGKITMGTYQRIKQIGLKPVADVKIDVADLGDGKRVATMMRPDKTTYQIPIGLAEQSAAQLKAQLDKEMTDMFEFDELGNPTGLGKNVTRKQRIDKRNRLESHILGLVKEKAKIAVAKSTAEEYGTSYDDSAESAINDLLSKANRAMKVLNTGQAPIPGGSPITGPPTTRAENEAAAKTAHDKWLKQKAAAQPQAVQSQKPNATSADTLQTAVGNKYIVRPIKR